MPKPKIAFEIHQAEYIKDYKLRLSFSDGKKRVVDFERFLKKSPNPTIRKYLNPDEFGKFSVEYGDLFCNDYDLCFLFPDSNGFVGQIRY